VSIFVIHRDGAPWHGSGGVVKVSAYTTRSSADGVMKRAINDEADYKRACEGHWSKALDKPRWKALVNAEAVRWAVVEYAPCGALVAK
jgi:hypothetical protein